MRIQASCHCGAVRYSCESHAPRPFMLCYCSICRKTAGGGGYAINLHAEADSLTVDGDGEAHISVYRGYLDFPQRSERSPGERRFCKHCGSPLWVWDPRWPELIHPFACAVDTPLPAAPTRSHILLENKPAWVPLDARPGDECLDAVPDYSLETWHRERGLWEGD